MSHMAKDIIKGMHYAVIATVGKDGQPWNTPVFASVDENLDVYWDSPIEAQHSKNIDAEPRVFIVIFDSNVDKEGKSRPGLYLKAKAARAEATRATEKYEALRQKTKPLKNAASEFSGESPKRIYRAIPEKAWTNGRVIEKGRKLDVRVEVPLL